MRYWLIPLLAAVANTLLCVVVYRHDRHNPINRVFSLTTATIISWNLNIFSLYYFQDAYRAFFWSKVFRTGTLLMPPTVVHLFMIFGNKKSRIAHAYLVAAYGLVTFLIVANAFDWLAAGVRSYEWGYYPVPRQLYVLHTVSVCVNFLFASALLINNIRHADSPHKRLQAQFWLLGAGVGIAAGITNLLPLYQIRIFPVGNIGNVAYTAIVAYAIIRHRLMDINVVVTKGMAYAAVSVLLVAPAFLALLWLQRESFGQIHSDFSFVMLLMLLTVGVLFPGLRLRAEARITQSFFRAKHEYRLALTAFTRSIVRILDRDQLINELGTTLSETLGLDHLAIALSDSSRHAFIVCHQRGTQVSTPEIAEHHSFIAVLTRRNTVALREEIEASAEPSEHEAVVDVCRANGWQVCIPLTVGGKLFGFISLGRKQNSDAFFAEDLQLLETLAAEASVALENARLYEELRKSQDIIRRADRLSSLGTLAAGIAHEVRNPLVSIQTFFQLAPQRLHDEEFFTTFLGMTASEVKRISDLITELLSFARSATRTPRPVSLNELVDRVVTLMEPEAHKQKISLSRKLSSAEPIVHADADQVKQVLINLVLNAIQATQPGGSVSIATRSADYRQRPFGQLEIQDTGSGIPQDRIEHIFDPFFTTKDKGTGLGLAIAHQIITEHGGSVSVESEEGRGTTFFVNLPAYADEAPLREDEEGENLESSGPRYTRSRRVAS